MEIPKSKVPAYHQHLTNATNFVRCAIECAERAANNSVKPEYGRIRDQLAAIHKRMYRMWERNVDRGKKEGWFK